VITRVSEHGLGNVIELRPPLVLTVADAHLIADRFADAMETVWTSSPSR
jgi:4-aminobutyrate aminotransferase